MLQLSKQNYVISRIYSFLRSFVTFSKTDKGFTLLEIVVAVIILGLAYVTVLQNFSVSMKNITRLDRSKTEVFEEVLAFEQLFQDIEDEEGAADNLPSFLEGRFYRLVVISSEDDEFMTLHIDKL